MSVLCVCVCACACVRVRVRVRVCVCVCVCGALRDEKRPSAISVLHQTLLNFSSQRLHLHTTHI